MNKPQQRALVLLLCLVSGCMSTHDMLVKRGFSDAYATGYEQGEVSGKVAAGYPYGQITKDPYRFDHDSEYRQGWTDGFATGKGQYEASSRDVDALNSR